MARVLDYGLEVIEFNLQSRCYVHLQTNSLTKGMNPVIPPVMSLILSLLYFYKDGCSFNLPMKVDMPLNKETETVKVTS